MTPAALIATVCGVGHLRPAPGTWGSLAALPLAWAIVALSGPWGLIAATVAAFAAGLWATAQVTRGGPDQDPSEVVIDEVAGQWIALWPVAVLAPGAAWPSILAFVLFRLFDIRKPGPVGWADRRGDPLGVMLDDVIAGALAAAVVALTLLTLG
ncbi:MAG: phosphatidylglycerophosphatase A family protein [Paracoccaceae bacterium]